MPPLVIYLSHFACALLCLFLWRELCLESFTLNFKLTVARFLYVFVFKLEPPSGQRQERMSCQDRWYHTHYHKQGPHCGVQQWESFNITQSNS